MEISPAARRTIARLALPTAIAAALVGQLHALARHATEDGAEDLEQPLTRAWAVPAAEALQPLLDWAHPDTVYLTYGKLWLPVFAVFIAAALLVYLGRSPRGFEKWAFRTALVGYLLAMAGVLSAYYTPFLDEAFLFLNLPGLVLSAVGSTALGIALLKNRFRPIATSVLLVAFIPLVVVITQVTSMGSAFLPLAFAWALAVSPRASARAASDADAASGADRVQAGETAVP